MLRQT